MSDKRVEILIIEAPEPCDQCRRAKEIANALAQKYEGISVRVIKVLDPEADKFGVVMTPTVVVNGVIISVRRAPDPERLERLVKTQLGGVAQ
ncbi:MAG: thioredoxin family protein [Armatimonadota bacterium]|nr:thioredoxin family protein [Armatimonadota bacterium]